MKHFTSLICAIGLLALTGCSSNRVEDLSDISKFHQSTTKTEPCDLKAGTVDLYVDYSDCMTTANKSEYFLGVQPAIIACAPNYYSIKGDQITFETNNKDKIHQLLNTITNVDYSAIKAAVDSIVTKNNEAILITDGEYYQKGVGANLNNPYLADEFKAWLKKGHDIYVYSEPYQSGNFTKKRYYMIFTDHRIDNNVHDKFSRNAPKSDDVKMVHLYSGLPTIDAPEGGVEFNEEAYANKEEGEINRDLKFESYLIDSPWDNINELILNALDENGDPINGGAFFLKGLKLNIPAEDAYIPEELEVKCYEISDSYIDNPSKGKLDKELKNVFTLDEKAWKNGDLVIKMDPNFDGKTLSGASGNLIRMDIRVKKSKDNFSDDNTPDTDKKVGIGENFKFDSPYGFNTSVYESLKQTLNDPEISPENSSNPVLYTIYLSTFENK